MLRSDSKVSKEIAVDYLVEEILYRTLISLILLE